jgi:hypothetical protein
MQIFIFPTSRNLIRGRERYLHGNPNTTKPKIQMKSKIPITNDNNMF